MQLLPLYVHPSRFARRLVHIPGKFNESSAASAFATHSHRICFIPFTQLSCLLTLFGQNIVYDSQPAEQEQADKLCISLFTALSVPLKISVIKLSAG